MQNKLVSIMMPAYNAEIYIGEAINSVLSQSYPYWELIVVDDGSTDATAKIVETFEDPRIKLFRQLNGGESSARNTALQNMHGEFVAFLDSDDIYLPEHLMSATAFLNNNTNFNAVYTDGYYCDSSKRLLKTFTSRRRGPFQGDVFAEAVRGSDLFGPPVSVVLQRKLIVDNNLQFDEEITIGPDWVFLMQYAANSQFGYLDNCTCLYRIHTSNISLRINLQKRAEEHAKCRKRAINMDRFSSCPIDVQYNVFHDLLVNSLRYQPEEQTLITQWPQFENLPTKEKGKLFRLMASQAILSGDIEAKYICNWLSNSVVFDSNDKRTKTLLGLFKFNPQFAKFVLASKRWGEVDPITITPFSDIDMSTSDIDQIVV